MSGRPLQAVVLDYLLVLASPEKCPLSKAETAMDPALPLSQTTTPSSNYPLTPFGHQFVDPTPTLRSRAFLHSGKLCCLPNYKQSGWTPLKQRSVCSPCTTSTKIFYKQQHNSLCKASSRGKLESMFCKRRITTGNHMRSTPRR
jgi:hypothetical protein